MHSRPAHIPPIHALERTPRRPMQHTRIIPHHQITLTHPLHTRRVLGLADMRIQRVDQLAGFRLGHAFDVVHVRRDVEVQPAAGLVALYEAVSGHGVLGWVCGGEEGGRGGFA